MFLFRKVKKRVPKTPNEVKEALERYLANSSPQLVKWLVSFWKDQQTVLTFKEIREAIQAGSLCRSVATGLFKGGFRKDCSRNGQSHEGSSSQ